MAETNRTNNLNGAQVFEYKQLPWGDLIYGTKEQLQGIGIGPGMAFPGETNGPKRCLRVTDPRGFIARVQPIVLMGNNLFYASISFPGREIPQEHISDFAQGVRKVEMTWGDLFTGTAESLSAAGIVRCDQLPGQPGMRKVTVTILADGSLPKGAPTANCREAREPGSKMIHKKSKTTYEVYVTAPQHEQDRRRDKYLQAHREWEERMRALPRPAPLCDLSPQREKQSARDTKDPGYESALKASSDSPARFHIGDVCIYWAPGDDFHGEKLEITSEYQFFRVNSQDGRFFDDGERFDYRWGYLARELGGQSLLYPAHLLVDINYRIRHLRLIGAVQDDTNEVGQAA